MIEQPKYYPKKSKHPLKAIRYFCFECMGWDRRQKDSGKPFNDVKYCTDDLCPLFDFRFGKNPFSTRSISEKHLEALKRGRDLYWKNKESLADKL